MASGWGLELAEVMLTTAVGPGPKSSAMQAFKLPSCLHFVSPALVVSFMALLVRGGMRDRWTWRLTTPFIHFFSDRRTDALTPSDQ